MAARAVATGRENYLQLSLQSRAPLPSFTLFFIFFISFSPSLDLLGLRDSRFVVRLLAEIIVENVDFRTKFMKIKILTGPSLGRNTNTLGEILFLGGNL